MSEIELKNKMLETEIERLKLTIEQLNCKIDLLDDIKQNEIEEKELYEEVIRLKEENEEYRSLIEMENKREYRSKFLKDFQKEKGKNVFPDYDEIYKRYDDYKKRIDKAIEYIEKNQNTDLSVDCYYKLKDIIEFDELLNILKGYKYSKKGDDKNE